MKRILYLAWFTLLVGCSTSYPLKPNDPVGVERTSDYCVRFDKQAQAYACNTGTYQCVSINGGLICSPNPAPSASPTPSKAK